MNLRLQIEDARGRRRKPGREACGPVAPKCTIGRSCRLGRTAAGRDEPRRHDVCRHRTLVVEQRAEREGRQRDRSGGEAFEGGPVVRFMQPPDALCLRGKAFGRPGRTQLSGVVLTDRLPGLIARHAAFVRQAHVVADRRACALEAREGVGAPLAHRCHQHRVDIRLRLDRAWLGTDAGKRRHGVDGFSEFA